MRNVAKKMEVPNQLYRDPRKKILWSFKNPKVANRIAKQEIVAKLRSRFEIDIKKLCKIMDDETSGKLEFEISASSS